MKNKEFADVLKEHLDFWPHLTPEQVKMILDHTKLMHYAAGETIHSAEHECIGVLIVKSGELRTYMLSEEGWDITLYRLNGGEVCILSASCILHSITFDVYIDAEKGSDVLLLNASVFSNIASQNLYVENFALRAGVERFSDVMWAMEQILFMNFDRRLAIFLITETARIKSDNLPLTHEQIAKYMGSAREVVSRMLKHFSSEGIVSLYRGGVRILDRTKLKSLIS